MKNTNNYVIINNRAYNPVTGLPVDGVDVRQATASAPVASPSTANRGVARVHKTAQHSKTLSRRYVKKPMTLQPVDKQPSEPIVAAYSPVNLQQLSSQKAEAVQKFAPTTAPTTAEPQAKRVDLPAQKHPVAHRATASSNTAALQRQRTTAQQKQSLDMRVQQPHAAQPKELKSSAVLKNEDILEAMNREMKVAQDDPDAVAAQLVAAIADGRTRLQIGWPERLFVRLNGVLPGLIDRNLRAQLPIVRRHART